MPLCRTAKDLLEPDVSAKSSEMSRRLHEWPSVGFCTWATVACALGCMSSETTRPEFAKRQSGPTPTCQEWAEQRSGAWPNGDNFTEWSLSKVFATSQRQAGAEVR